MNFSGRVTSLGFVTEGFVDSIENFENYKSSDILGFVKGGLFSLKINLRYSMCCFFLFVFFSDGASWTGLNSESSWMESLLIN